MDYQEKLRKVVAQEETFMGWKTLFTINLK